MGNCNNILSIHNGMGTTQIDRFNAALQTNFILLDERNEEDFILFVQKLSHYVKYFNGFNIEEGNWANFYEKESTAILILIANWNIDLVQNSFEIKKNEILLNTDFAIQQNLLLDFFNDLESIFNQLLGKINLLDNDISEKENLIASAYVISEIFFQIKKQINDSKNIPSLLKHFTFLKGTQQLFGLLLSWKNFSQNAVDFQLNNYSKHSPHYALFLSFLKLLNFAKDQLNGFTKKHLDFYYKDILQIENQLAKPDFAHLVITPYKNLPFLIPKNTIFLGGKNSSGQKKYFASTSDQTVNGISLNAFYSQSRNGAQYFKTENLLPFNGVNKGFNVFTSTATEFQEGIMIASPILYLQSGERTINIRFNSKNYSAKDFSFYLTGEKKVIEISGKNEGNFIALNIPATEKKIIPFDEKLHPEFLVKTSFPVLKIMPKNRSVISTINKIELNIEVTDFKSFILESDFGTINPEKPFYPFGEFPKSGNGITLESNEFFMKENAVATLYLIPDGKAANYFDSNCETFFLNDGKFVAFPPVSKEYLEKRNGFNETRKTAKVDSIFDSLPNNYPLLNFNFKDIANPEITSNGKFRIELQNSSFDNETFLESFIAASKDGSTLPYKPKIKEFIFNYSASEVVDFTKKTTKNSSLELYQVLPYGFFKLANRPFRFSKMNELEGQIFLGFENATPKDALTFLIQLQEGTANPMVESAKISWYFLSENKWISLDSEAIADETFSFSQSGLVGISIPEFNAENNTIFPPDLFWVKISVSNIQAICNFLGVHTQALKVVLTDFENIGTAFLETTPKETISKLFSNIIEVKKVSQPYESFGGKLAEKDQNLYQRSSERLRHKARAITSWDYERIILQEFPEVFRVKTLNHYRYDTEINNSSAGFVTLIPFAKTSNTENVSWKPMLSLNKMTLIKKFLSKITSPHVQINVKPPKLEKVVVQFNVKFRPAENMDTRLYIAELTDTINRYLSPWAYENDELNFANNIEFSSIIQLIDNQPYVDYLTDFKILQYLLDENNNTVGNAIQNLTKITPQTDFSLFIPNESYPIKEI